MGDRSAGRSARVRALSVLVALVGVAGIVAALAADEPRPGTLSAADGATSTMGSSTTTTTSAAPPEAAPTSEAPPVPDPTDDPATPAAPPTTAAATPATRPPAPARGRRIFCGTIRWPDGQGLESLALDGTDRRVIASDSFREQHVAPDGSWLIATRWPGHELYRMDPEGRSIAKLSDGRWQSPKISPDGQRIAGVVWFPQGDIPRLVVLDRSGTVLTEFGEFDPNVSSLDWMPDGRRIAFTSGTGNVVTIFDLAARAVASQAQYIPMGTIGYPAVSPDGRRIAVSSGGDLYVIPTEGGQYVEVTRDVRYEANRPVWQDDDTLLFSYEMGVARIRVDGTGFEVVTEGCTDPTIGR